MIKKIKNYTKEHKRGLKVAAVILALGIIYYILIQLTSFRLVCVFRKITGLACPGCGITTQINRLSHLEFKEAITENLAIAIICPIYIIIYALRLIFNPKCLQNDGWLFKFVLYFTIAFLIIFGILRNIKGFEFLLPSYMR